VHNIKKKLLLPTMIGLESFSPIKVVSLIAILILRKAL